MKETGRWMVGLSLAILWTALSPELAWPPNASGATAFYSYNKPLPLPDFSLENLQGNMVQIKDYKGRVILLHFWATW